jgi:TRAP-type C4-dicarboxylate transport system permease small subunit
VEKLRKAESLLVKLESGLLVALLGGMATLAFVQVARRQLFGTGALWADTLLRYLVLWVGFLGAALAAADEKHFAWEAAAQKGGKAGDRMRLAANLAAVVVSGLLTRASWAFFLDERAAGQTLFTIGRTDVAEWIFALAIPVGFALVGLHLACRAAHSAGKLRGQPE